MSIDNKLWLSLTEQCHLAEIRVQSAVCYSFCVSSLFVLSLYALVPEHIRRLPRDDPKQIKRRMVAVLIVCLVSTLTFPLIFCGGDGTGNDGAFSALELMGWNLKNLGGALLHSMFLYLGPITMILCQILVTQQRRNSNYSKAFYAVVIQPNMPTNAVELWRQLRNLIFAPFTEEVAFRGCIVPPLLASGLHPVTVAFVAPLFFGTAHFHHAYLKLERGENLKNVALIMLFQFTYTTLFGAYATHAFIRTNSVLAVFFSHSFCNGMGLPDVGFLMMPRPASPLYKYVWIIRMAHIGGIILFVMGFSFSFVLPEKSVFVQQVKNSSLQ